VNILEQIKRSQPYTWRHSDLNPELQLTAKQRCWEYNQTQPKEAEKRRNILVSLFGSCHELTFIEPSFRCDYGFNIFTHGLVVINYNCVILDTSPVHIGAGVFIAPGVCISCAGHAVDPEQRAGGVCTSAPITIEDEVWIGANVTVCAGVTIGKGSVIGAGSVVTKDVPAGVIAVGCPCRVVRPITEKDRIEGLQT
jgi:maltose O-acetyltransferase